LQDDESLVKDVCVWLGDETENLLQPEADFCKTLDELLNDGNFLGSSVRPSFLFDWDSTKFIGGIYNIYAITRDNAGNKNKIKLELPDYDFDGFLDIWDNCPWVANQDQADIDRDGVGDVCDNCLMTPNSWQCDYDNDGIGNVCGDNEAELIKNSYQNKEDLMGHLYCYTYAHSTDERFITVEESLKYQDIAGVSEYGKITPDQGAVLLFCNNGTLSTKRLGRGERAGVVNSYKSAFGKLPQTVSEWEDVIKIANGRWPGETSPEAEARANDYFHQIYLRDADRSNSHDDAAITIIAYGLRPLNRNLESEEAAIRIFKSIFSYNPTAAVDWDMVRAIAYSGAVR
jgi:hypothetical protein